MQQSRALSVICTLGTVAFLALPLAVTNYLGNHGASVNLPSFHATHSGPDWAVTPTSGQKVEAVRQVRTSQI